MRPSLEAFLSSSRRQAPKDRRGSDLFKPSFQFCLRDPHVREYVPVQAPKHVIHKLNLKKREKLLKRWKHCGWEAKRGSRERRGMAYPATRRAPRQEIRKGTRPKPRNFSLILVSIVFFRLIPSLSRFGVSAVWCRQHSSAEQTQGVRRLCSNLRRDDVDYPKHPTHNANPQPYTPLPTTTLTTSCLPPSLPIPPLTEAWRSGNREVPTSPPTLQRPRLPPHRTLPLEMEAAVVEEEEEEAMQVHHNSSNSSSSGRKRPSPSSHSLNHPSHSSAKQCGT